MKANVKAKTKTVKNAAATQAKAKPAVKSSPVATAKGGGKAPVKSGSSPKPVVKVKVVAKPVAKAVPTKVVKAVVRPQTDAKSKSKSKSAAQQPAAKKPVARSANAKFVATQAASKPAVKAVAAPAPKVVPKASPKVASKAPVKTSNPKVSGKAPVQAAPVKVSTPAASKPVNVSTTTAPKNQKIPASKPIAVAPISAKVPAVPVTPAAPALPLPIPSHGVVQKGGRPSARLVQITVPSMAQAVASTAAKASFIDVPAPLVTPPFTYTAKKDPKLVNNWKTKAGEALTDAELIAMPDAEYMNDKQMAAFRAKLAKLRQEILASAGETTEHLREDTVVVPDPADRATIEEEHALELRTRDRERKLLKKIEQSINRIDAGDYGYCDETGEAIGVGRLLARPTANLSLEAQQRRELKQKMFGD